MRSLFSCAKLPAVDTPEARQRILTCIGADCDVPWSCSRPVRCLFKPCFFETRIRVDCAVTPEFRLINSARRGSTTPRSRHICRNIRSDVDETGSPQTASTTTQSGRSGFFGDCRERSATGGYFSFAVFNSPVSALNSSHFGPLSPVRKFPFLALSIGGERRTAR